MKRSPRTGRTKAKPIRVDLQALIAIALGTAVIVATNLTLRTIAASAPSSATMWLRASTASAAGWAVRAAGIPVTVSGGTGLVLRNHVLRIDLACTAFDWLVLFAVGIVVLPVVANRKKAALFVGLPVIVVLNILRLVAVALVSEYAPERFALIHGVVLQACMAVLVSSMWVVFLWYAREDWRPGWGWHA